MLNNRFCYLKKETQPASEKSCFFLKNLDNGQPEKNVVIVIPTTFAKTSSDGSRHLLLIYTRHFNTIRSNNCELNQLKTCCCFPSIGWLFLGDWIRLVIK